MKLFPNKISNSRKGYTIKLVSGALTPSKHEEIIFNLHEDKFGSFIGRVRLEWRDGKYRTHSSLYNNYHNDGLGIYLYATAIKYCLDNKLPISSSGFSSAQAERLWQSKRLNKMFKIRKVKHNKYNFGTTWYPKSIK